MLFREIRDIKTWQLWNDGMFPKKTMNRTFHACDSETDNKGNPILICISTLDFDRKSNRTVTLNAENSPDGRILSYDALSFILHNGQDSIVWFYNIKFDFDSIVKEYVVNNETRKFWIEKLRPKNGTPHFVLHSKDDRPDLNVRYIQGKYFEIYLSKKDGAKRTYCYDVANFCKEFGLDRNAKSVLDLSKEQYNVSNDQLFNAGIDIENLKWHKLSSEQKSTLVKRCSIDAWLTRLLAEKIANILHEQGIHPRHWNSLASVTREHILREMKNEIQLLRPFTEDNWCDNHPDSRNEHDEMSKEAKTYRRKCVETIWRTYRGAIFKLYCKGYKKGVTEIDLRSAYASTMPLLEDCAYGQWHYVLGNDAYPNTLDAKRLWDYLFSKGERPDIFYGHYHVLCQYSGSEMYRFYSTNVFTDSSTLKTFYPETRSLFEDYLTLPEIEFLRERGYYVEIIEGYEFRHSSEPIKYPFRDYIANNIRLKNESKARGDKLGEYIWKQLSNCLYGCTAMTVGKKTGQLFCPPYASYITALIRIKLTKLSKRFFELTIAELTDAVIGVLQDNVTKEQIEAEGFDIKEVFESEKGYFFLRNGLTIDDEGFFIQSRGTMKKTDDESLLTQEFIRIPYEFVNDPQAGLCIKVEIPKKRTTLKEGIIQNKPNSINKFKSKPKLIRLEDSTRKWLEEITEENVKTKLIESEPIDDDALRQWDSDLDVDPIILSNGKYAYVRKQSREEITTILQSQGRLGKSKENEESVPLSVTVQVS